MRLNRFLAGAGVASRRHCDELIAAGRVTINGKVCTNFSAQPNAHDHVKVDGKLVRAAPALTIMLHKPAGVVSTRKDPHARDTVFDLLPPKFYRLFNIGRLDAQTEGLLLLTNDGDLAQRLTHPRFKVEKESDVTLDGCNALITGASAGIGCEFARQLADRARSIILVARRSERLGQLREELLNRNPNLDVHVRVVDLADKAQIGLLIELLAHDKVDVDLLVNNAGLGDSGAFATS